MTIDTTWLLTSFLLYFISLFFFFFMRFYIFSKSFIILMSISLFNILYQYYYLFFDCILCINSIYYQLTNFTVDSGLLSFSIALTIQPLTYLFSLLVLVIGFCTNIYALNYFKNEADEMGFLFWLNSFILSMLILVLAGNFLTLFLGWELIGFTSFFLINFWQSRRATLKSSFKAFSFNLVSDLFLLTFLIILYSNLHTSEIDSINSLTSHIGLKDSRWLKFSVFCLIVCSSIKSVQILGHLWLPDSMEAPVPASSLIHSATLVSAGIFLLLRFYHLIVIVEYTNYLITLGSITAAYGGVVAASQTDVKKLLAYSTMSHCGFLVVLVGLGNCYITIIYLFLHGLFKASTFFCVGSLIRVYGGQDTRIMGGSNRLMWGDSILLIVCAVNLCGLPLSIGFIYKLYFFKSLFAGIFTFFDLGLLFVAMLSSLIYFFRLIYYSIFDRWKLLWGTSPFLWQIFETRNLKDKRISLYYDHWSDSRFTTFGHWVAVFIIIIFSIYVFFFIEYFLSVQVNLDDFIYTYFVNSNYLIQSFFIFYNSYLIFFYFFYFFLFFLIVFVAWRKNFFFFDKLNFYIYVLLLSIIFILICEVRS